MAVYKRGKVWWYKFTWSGEQIRESTKQSNKRVAEQMEATHKTSLAKGEVGIRERKPGTDASEKFLDDDFLLFVRSTKAAKPNTVRFYENSASNLKRYAKLAAMHLDQITSEHIAGFVAHRQAEEVEISTVNRDLATLRRAFSLRPNGERLTTIPRRCGCLAEKTTVNAF